jgi:carboxymethylenebutenolidase
MIERQLDIATRDGATSTFIVHPDRGGPHPVVGFLMDAPAIREELRDMARRYASSGYYVSCPTCTTSIVHGYFGLDFTAVG